MEGQGRPTGLPYSMYVVSFSRGMIEGGSSGSGAFTRTNGRLELTGVLSRGPVDDSCTNTDKFVLYGLLEAIYPQLAQYIGATSPGADDAPNRPDDVTASVSGAPPTSQPVTLTRSIDYSGDIDVFRFTVSSMVAVTGFTTGGQDLVSSILDHNGIGLEANDDAETVDNDTGITRLLAPGTYYFHVAHWTPSATGPYQLVLRADRVDALNYTALWWNEAESGWGINLNHQGNILFAALFTYDDAGAPTWLVMSRGERGRRLVLGNAASHHRPGLQRQPVDRDQRHRGRHDAPRLFRAQCRHAHLYRQRAQRHQGDHAPGVQDAAGVLVVVLRPQLRGQPPGSLVEPGAVGLGDQLRPPGEHAFRHALTYAANGQGCGW